MRSAGVRRWSSLALALALVAASAAADWTRVGGDGRIHEGYADRDGIRPKGANVTMPGLYDFTRADLNPEGLPYRSTVVLREYDCAGRRVRLLSYIDFAGRMGTGAVVSRVEREGRWEPVVEGALDEAFLKAACGAGG